MDDLVLKERKMRLTETWHNFQVVLKDRLKSKCKYNEILQLINVLFFQRFQMIKCRHGQHTQQSSFKGELFLEYGDLIASFLLDKKLFVKYLYVREEGSS